MLKYLNILILFLILILSGCSPEYKLARQYIRNHKSNALMLIPLYEIGKDNLTLNCDTNILYLYSPFQLDSMAWAQSAYVKSISDSVFLTRFTSSMINELNRAGFDIYVSDSSDFFNKLPDPKWLVKVAHLQLNEKHTVNNYNVCDEKVEGVIDFTASLRMNMLNLHSWFEASQTETGNKQVLYLEESIMDNRTLGYDFALNKGYEGLQQNRDSLEMEDVYKLADESGIKHAELLLNHFLNEYISRNLPVGITKKKYFYYDRILHSLKPGLNQWIELEEKKRDDKNDLWRQN